MQFSLPLISLFLSLLLFEWYYYYLFTDLVFFFLFVYFVSINSLISLNGTIIAGLGGALQSVRTGWAAWVINLTMLKNA